MIDRLSSGVALKSIEKINTWCARIAGRFASLPVALFFMISLSQSLGAEDIWPWPAGSECPFPWSTIEGDWLSSENIQTQRLHFEVAKRLEDGTQVLDVLHYDQSGNLIGWGRGLSVKRERIVRVRMEYVSEARRGEYWGILRTYGVDQGSSSAQNCRKERRITVFTLSPVDKSSKEKEIHIVIVKGSS